MDKTKGFVIVVAIFGVIVFAAFVLTVFLEPKGQVIFKANPRTGEIEWIWIPLLFGTVPEDFSSELTNEDIEKIRKYKDEFKQKASEVALQKEIVGKLENGTIVLEQSAETNPKLVPALVTTTKAYEESKSALGDLTLQISEVEVKYFETLDGINLVIPEDEKDLVFSTISLLNYPRIDLDQKVYTWTDKAYITITDPWANKNPNELDVIGGKENSQVKIFTESGNELDYILKETGPNTGFFNGEIILTGFPSYDANSDGNTDDASGETKGSGPYDGMIGTQMEDILYVSYQYDVGEMTSTSSLIRWNVGWIQFDKSSYQVDETATIILVDPDLNLNPNQIDFVSIKVDSDTLTQGISVKLEETNSATGIFEGLIKFTLEQKPSKNLLKVSLGDQITARYKENTFPIPEVELIGDLTATSRISEKIIP